ncbi:MAG: hypothetical protein ACK4V6_16425, partial [Microthrixaceae bacterium]
VVRGVLVAPPPRGGAGVVGGRGAGAPPTALRWTKYTMNSWLRSAGPAFDASVAMEMLGFTGPDVAEGIAAIEQKRRPQFTPGSPDC